MLKRIITHVFKFFWGYEERTVEIFYIPINIVEGSQEVVKVYRLNKLLPVGHRMRGDVGGE